MINARSSNKQVVGKFDRKQTVVRNRLNGRLSSVRRKISKIPENMQDHFSPEAYVCLATDFDLKDLLKGIPTSSDNSSSVRKDIHEKETSAAEGSVWNNQETDNTDLEKPVRDQEFNDAVVTIDKVLDEEPVVREDDNLLREKISKLQDKLLLYRANFEKAKKAYLFFSVDHMVIMDANEFAAEMLGNSSAKLAGVPITNVCDPDDWPLLGNFILSLVSKKKASAYLNFIGPKNRRYPCSVSGTLVRGEDGMLGIALNAGRVMEMAS